MHHLLAGAAAFTFVLSRSPVDEGFCANEEEKITSTADAAEKENVLLCDPAKAINITHLFEVLVALSLFRCAIENFFLSRWYEILEYFLFPCFSFAFINLLSLINERISFYFFVCSPRPKHKNLLIKRNKRESVCPQGIFNGFQMTQPRGEREI